MENQSSSYVGSGMDSNNTTSNGGTKHLEKFWGISTYSISSANATE